MTVDDIALTMHPEIGSRTAIHLVECFGSAERLFARRRSRRSCSDPD